MPKNTDINLTDYKQKIADKPVADLRRGWTTGACATACAVAGVRAYLDKKHIKSVLVTLPTTTHTFDICNCHFDENGGYATTIKDAGDDPDVTHGAEISVHITPHKNGLKFVAGNGVGTVTKAGLPLGVGEPAINPKPRDMIRKNLIAQTGHDNWCVTISVKDGEKIAERTWNRRLGIMGGISILGTTGIVIPFSCSAWIDSIRRGIDVAICDNIPHIIGATGKNSEFVSQGVFNAPTQAMIDMGDFIGAMCTHAKRTDIGRVTVAGGFAKIVKLAQGHLDVHSARSQVDFDILADWASESGASTDDIHMIKTAPTALFVLENTHSIDIVKIVANHATATLSQVFKNSKNPHIKYDICIVSRGGEVLYYEK